MATLNKRKGAGAAPAKKTPAAKRRGVSGKLGPAAKTALAGPTKKASARTQSGAALAKANSRADAFAKKLAKGAVGAGSGTNSRTGGGG